MKEMEKIKLLRASFKGRADAYGTGSKEAVKETISDAVLKAHVQGKSRVGIYPLSPDILDGSGTWWIAADIDIEDLGYAAIVAEALEHLDIPCYVERSKSKGYHIWVFFSEPIEAKWARAIIFYASAVLERDTEARIYEMFPKQNTIKHGDGTFGYGNYINLPIFGTDAQKGRTVFLNALDHYKPYPDQWAFLKSIKRTTPAHIHDLIEIGELVEVPEKREPKKRETPGTFAILGINGLLAVMMEKCAFCGEFLPDTGEIHEELWYRWLTQMVCFEGGEELAYQLSSGSPKFDSETTRKKIAHAKAAKEKGLAPYTCAEIIDCEGWKSEECLSCIAHPSRRNSSPAGLPHILKALDIEKQKVVGFDKNEVVCQSQQKESTTQDMPTPDPEPEKSGPTPTLPEAETIPDSILDAMAEQKVTAQEVDLFQKKKTKEDFSPYFKKDTFIPKLLANDILSDNRFINIKGLLYRYHNGVYVDDGEQFIEAESQKKLSNESRQNRIGETVYYIKIDSYTEPELVNPTTRRHLLNVQNGIYDWIEGKLLPHNPEYFSTIRIPIEYNPEATCPTVDYFLESALPSDCVPIAEELFGYALIPYVRFEKAFMFTGTGANGKSTFLTLLEHFVGSKNVSKVPLQDLDEHRFKRAELFGKLLNLFADLDSRDLQSSTYFKTIVSGDAIDAERKFQDPFFFRPFARLVFSANEVPRSPDNSYAYFRRWCIIPFPNRFEGKDADKSLADRMTEPNELSGLLNRALSGLHRLFENEGFTESATIKASLDDYKKQNDTIAAFIGDCCIFDATSNIERGELYTEYTKYCESEGYKSLGRNECYGKIRTYPQITEKGDGKKRYFCGILQKQAQEGTLQFADR